MIEKDPRVAPLPKELKTPFLTGCTFTHCGMHGTSYPVRPRGHWRAPIAWIGEAAGLQEEKINCTFVGPAGELTEEVLSSLSMSFDKNFFCPNVCLCRPHPEHGSTKQNRTPLASEIQACQPHVDKIISLHQPKLIVLVGGKALKAIVKNAPNVSQAVGQFYSSKSHSLPCQAEIYTIWHPAYILRNLNEKEKWIHQLTKLRDFAASRGYINNDR